MIPKIKKGLFLTILCCSVFLFPACDKAHQEPSGSEWSNRDTWISSGAASEQGYYYFRDENYLCFYDFASQKSVYLCEKTGCTHRDGDCNSYMLFANPSAIFYYENYLYFLEGQMDGLKLTRRHADGSNYEEILTLMNAHQENKMTFNVSDYKVCGNLLYYIGSATRTLENGQTQSAGYLYEVNLAAGKEKLLLELGEEGGSLVSARKGKVLIQQIAYDSKTLDSISTEQYKSKEFLSSIPNKILLWEEETGEASTLIEDNCWNLYGAIAAYEDSYYIIRWDSNHETNYVEKISMNTKETETVLTLDCKVSNYSVPSNDELLFLLSPSKEWNSFQLPNFPKHTLSLLKREDRILYSTEKGYIINRMLEYEGDLETGATITKAAYSYLSFEDAKAGKENYVDFYIRDDSES